MEQSKITLLLVFLGIATGGPIGAGVATFFYADGASYFSNNPRACINCHIMNSQYQTWQSSSHKTVAGCNECHSNGNTLEKYFQKAVNGFLHSYAFTTGHFQEPIFIKDFNKRIVQQSCLACHASFVHNSQGGNQLLSKKNCTDCHRDVGHRKW